MLSELHICTFPFLSYFFLFSSPIRFSNSIFPFFCFVLSTKIAPLETTLHSSWVSFGVLSENKKPLITRALDFIFKENKKIRENRHLGTSLGSQMSRKLSYKKNVNLIDYILWSKQQQAVVGIFQTVLVRSELVQSPMKKTKQWQRSVHSVSFRTLLSEAK